MIDEHRFAGALVNRGVVIAQTSRRIAAFVRRWGQINAMDASRRTREDDDIIRQHRWASSFTVSGDIEEISRRTRGHGTFQYTLGMIYYHVHKRSLAASRGIADECVAPRARDSAHIIVIVSACLTRRSFGTTGVVKTPLVDHASKMRGTS